MTYFYFILGILHYMIFAWDLENDRDFMTWMWLLCAIYWIVYSYEHYKEDNRLKIIKEDNILNITIKSNLK